jgi:hypothetical protein
MSIVGLEADRADYSSSILKGFFYENGSTCEPSWFHACGTAGGDRDHRNLGGLAVARGSSGT